MAVATKKEKAGFNFEYADIGSLGVDLEAQGPRRPWLQVDRPKPAEDQEVSIGFVEDSWDMLPDTVQTALKAKIVTARFGSGSDRTEVTMMVPASEVRYVLLGIPKLFVIDGDGAVDHLRRGVKLGNGRKTVARLHMAMVIDGQLALDDDGLPLIVTLKLKSMKTALIGRNSDKAGDGTIHALNNAVLSHFKARGKSLLHLVSVCLVAKAEYFVSKATNEGSMGVRYEFEGSARPLPQETAATLAAAIGLIEDELKDPFGIATPKQDDSIDYEVTIESEDGDSLPF